MTQAPAASKAAPGSTLARLGKKKVQVLPPAGRFRMKIENSATGAAHLKYLYHPL